MMKHHYLLFRMLALVAALACALGAHAEYSNYYTGGVYYNLYDEGDAEVSEGPNNFRYSGSVTIASSVYYNGNTYPVTGIGQHAFSICTGLTSVSIPTSVKIIRSEAFTGCTGLTSLTFPASVYEIGFEAFRGCTNLTSITCLGTTPPNFYDLDDTTEDLDPFSDVTYTRATLYVPKGCKSAYQQTGYWKYWYKFRNIQEMNDPFCVNGIYYIFSDEYDGVEVYEGPNDGYYSGSVIIPSTVYYGGKTYNVVGIAGDAFWGCSGLTSVTIPNSVKIIRTQAFSYCTGLTSLTIPASVEYIGCEAFYGCTNLNRITSLRTTAPSFYDLDNTTEDLYPFSDVTYTRATLYVPKGCKSAYQQTGYWKYWYKFRNIVELPWDFMVNGIYYAITGSNTVEVTYKDTSDGDYSGSVSIPSSVTYGGKTYQVKRIGDLAFNGSTGLTSVTIPNSITSIGVGSFANCSGLTSLTIPSSVTTIDNLAFYGCTGLTSMEIPNSVTTFGTGVFGVCSGLTSVTLPNSLTAIADYTFWNCTGLTSVTIPNSVTTIGEYAFYGCTSLEFVTLPNSVTTIGEKAFSNCNYVERLVIGSSVTSIGANAFNECYNLRFVGCLATTPPTMAASNVFDNDTYSYASLAVPKGRKSAYQTANWWKNFDEIDELFYDFFKNGFYYTITGSNTVEVATGATDSYSGSVTVPSSVSYNGTTYQVTGIGDGAFGACQHLTSVTIPNTVTYIGAFAFSESPLLSGIVIPNTVTRIGDSAFEGCVGLTSITIPNSVTTIAKRAFRHCESLSSVTIGSGVTSIGDEAFWGCDALRYVTCLAVTPPVMEEEDVFEDDTYNSGTLKVPKGCKSAYQAANWWKNFTTIQELAYTFVVNGIYYAVTGSNTVGVSNNGSGTVYSGSVTIPSSVSYGGKTYNVTSIQTAAFYNAGLTSVTLPNTLTTIGITAFQQSGLTSVTIPASVTSIGSSAFAYCSLTSVTCLATTPPTMAASNVFDDFTYSNATLTVPGASLSAYQTANYWKNFTHIQGDGSSFLLNGIYYNVTGDNTVEVTYKDATYNSYNGNVAIPGVVSYGGKSYNVTAIGEAAFRQSEGLTSVVIPISVKEIGTDAFYYCTSLTSVVIPSSVTKIGNYAFNYCTSLTNMTIGSSVTSIGYQAFRNCPALVSVTCLATTPPTLTSTTFISSQYSSVKLFVPKRALAAYQAANYWKNFTQMHPTLDYALNTDGGAIEFSSTGYYPWTNVVEDGRVYAVSGNKGAQSRSSTMTTTVTLPSDGKVTFAYKAWGEGASSDVCTFSVDGTQKFSYGNKQNNWVNYSAQLSAGTHTLTWTYSKNSSVNPEGDYFAVDNVVITVNTIPGDADGDGVVTVGDVTAIIDMILSGVTSGTPGADVDGNGIVNIADVTALIDYILTGN